MKIAYIDGPRLRRALIAACEHVQRSRAELNRINVFPVPDGDTGTNLALTASSVADHLRTSRERSASAVARAAAEAGVLGARGNAGMIFSHFLIGFSEAVGDRRRLSAAGLRDALHAAADHLYRALERPVEGTILTVMREVAEEARAAFHPDIQELLGRVLVRARDALARTPDLLPVLRKAGVVDAGAKGFVHLLEGVEGLIRGVVPVASAGAAEQDGNRIAAGAVEFSEESERFRFCTEGLVRGSDLPDTETVKAALRPHGDSLIAIRSGDILKVHVHTDEPDVVFEYLRGLGQLVAHKAEDMHIQHEALARADGAHLSLARRPVALLSDTGCDLPEDVVRAHGITLVPLQLVYADSVLEDRVGISAAEFEKRLLAGEHPTTSQPTPAAFLDGLRRAASDGESVFGVILASGLSGTFASAEAAAKRVDGARITLFDSQGASLLQGLLLLRAAELAELGWSVDRIAAELTRVRARSGLMFTVDAFDRLLASGRVTRGRALLGRLLDLKPIIEVTRAGKAVSIGRARGRKNVLAKAFDLLEERVPRDVAKVRFGIVHVACPEVVERVAAELRRRYGEREILTGPATPVFATHIGAGAWGLAWMIED